MTRGPRRLSNSDIYHVVSRGVGHCVIFEDNADRLRFLEELASVAEDYGAEIYTWCLMDNHYHILLKLEAGKLSDAMKRLDSTYALYFNTRHERVGHLFQGRFKSEPVESDSYFLTVLRYIHQNPVKAGICSSCDYLWSSYRAYTGEEDAAYPGLVSTDMALDMLGGLRELREFHSSVDYGSACCDIGRGRRLVSDEDAAEVARAVLGGLRPNAVSGLDRGARDAALCRLRAAGLSVRQVERLTGVSRGVIARIKC